MKKEFCIMPPIGLYAIERFPNSHRHEVMYGRGLRQKSIDKGLIVFLTPEQHNMSNAGVHFNKAFDLQLKQIAQETAMEYYGWSTEDFIREFGRNYL